MYADMVKNALCKFKVGIRMGKEINVVTYNIATSLISLFRNGDLLRFNTQPFLEKEKNNVTVVGKSICEVLMIGHKKKKKKFPVL